MKPNPFLFQVLQALADAEDKGRFSTPKWIADEVFPKDHPGWQRSCKCGPYGSHRGSGLVMMMGGYLGKLRKAGLVDRYHGKNTLTSAGRKMLKEKK